METTTQDDDYYSIDALINRRRRDADEAPGGRADPAPGPADVIDPNMLSYTALSDPDMKLTFNYPSNWINVPGIFTVCYREKVEPGNSRPGSPSPPSSWCIRRRAWW